MAKKKEHKAYGVSREELVTGKAPKDEGLDKNSREYKATHKKENK